MRLPLVTFVVFVLFLVRPFGHVNPVAPVAAAETQQQADDSAVAGLSAEESQEKFVTHPGVRVTLAAKEPQTVDPISIRFDQRGRMWVVEMHDYPTGPAEGVQPAGRIRVLTDTDADDIFETAQTFIDGLLFPTGIQPWQDGVIVTLAGKIVYFADHDGDGVADEQQTWFEGFAEENEQLRANHPTLGPDGRIYVAGGLRGGTVEPKDPRWPSRDKPLKLSQQDFAFDPHGGYWGGVTGNSQFGLTIDDYGRRIGCSNRNPAIEAIFSRVLVQRDPLLLPAQAYRDAALVGPESSVRPITQAWTTSNLHAGQFSAACGVLFGSGTGLPQAWRDDLFICEPTGYLVQRQETRREHGHLIARRAPVDEEFLASADSYFRPVDLAVGPDGALYVVDMYRAVIEHPDWAPAELKERPDERYGDQRGRIWRVGMEDHVAAGPLAIDSVSTEMLVELLGHPNRWQRETASRLLYERSGGAEAIDALVPVMRASLHGSARPAVARARVAHWLASVDRLTAEDCLRLLDDSEPLVRALAVEFSEPFAAADQRILQLADDADASVQLQVAVALGGEPMVARASANEPLVDALVTIAQQYAGADTFEIALGAVHPSLLAPLLQRLAAQPSDRAVSNPLLKHLATRVGLQKPDTIDPLLTEVTHSGSLRTIVRGVLEGYRRRGDSLDELRQHLSEPAQRSLDRAFAESLRVARDRSAPTGDRLQGLALLAFSQQVDAEFLRELVAFDQPPAVRLAAVPLLYGHDQQWFLQWFDRNGSSLPPELRSEAIDQMLRSSATSLWLLQRVSQKKVPASTIGLNQSKRLLRSSDPEVRAQAQQVLAEAGADRQAVVQRYQAALSGDGDPLRGRKIFQEQCAACHRVDGIGTDVGAEISDSRTKTKAALLTAILHPNAAIDAAFLRYTVLTLDGKVVDGLLVKETADEVTLKVQGGELVVTPRSEIETFQTAGVSLMPDGFEQVIDVDQMRDLISFLKNWRYLDGSVPVETLSGP